MKRLLAAVPLSLLLSGCLFGGPGSPTLEMQNPPASGPVDIQILDSAVKPGEIYLKLVVHNANARPLLIDRRCLVLTDGRAEWRAVPTSKPFVTVKPNATSAKLKLSFEGVPAGLPSYDLSFKRGAFRLDSEAGQEVALPTVRLLVKTPTAATPAPSKTVAAAAQQPR